MIPEFQGVAGSSAGYSAVTGIFFIIIECEGTVERGVGLGDGYGERISRQHLAKAFLAGGGGDGCFGGGGVFVGNFGFARAVAGKDGCYYQGKK